MSKWITLMLAAAPILAQDSLSLQKEAALGAFMSADFEKQTTPLDAPEVTSYIDRLGRQIASQFPEFKLPFTIHVILDQAYDQPTREPIWIPGGHVFVSVHLIMSARDSAEFARMLAHSMAHVALHHGFKISTATVPLVFLGSTKPIMLPAKYRPAWEANEREADAAADRFRVSEDLDGAFASIQERLRSLFPPPAKPSLLTR